MNYNSMTARELIHYLDLYSTDPVVRKLVTMFSDDSLVAELVDAGMDPATQTFTSDYQDLSPGDYIQQLRRDIDELESDLNHTKYQLEEATGERDELKTRSIMDFIQEVHQEKQTNAHLVKEAMSTVKAYRDENTKLKEQIDMWGRMNQVKVTV